MNHALSLATLSNLFPMGSDTKLKRTKVPGPKKDGKVDKPKEIDLNKSSLILDQIQESGDCGYLYIISSHKKGIQRRKSKMHWIDFIPSAIIVYKSLWTWSNCNVKGT